MTRPQKYRFSESHITSKRQKKKKKNDDTHASECAHSMVSLLIANSPKHDDNGTHLQDGVYGESHRQVRGVGPGGAVGTIGVGIVGIVGGVGGVGGGGGASRLPCSRKHQVASFEQLQVRAAAEASDVSWGIEGAGSVEFGFRYGRVPHRALDHA